MFNPSPVIVNSIAWEHRPGTLEIISQPA